MGLGLIVRRAGCGICFWLVVVLLPAGADAAFINGRENFAGTVIDTATWSISIPRATQNNGLTIDTISTGDFADATSTFPLGLGSTVRVAATVDGRGPPSSGGGNVFVALTSNSYTGPFASFIADDAYMYIAETSFGFIAFEGRQGSAGGLTISNQQAAVGQTYIYEITRNSHTSATFRVYDAYNQLIGSVTDNTLGTTFANGFSIPDQLYIALYDQSCAATFHYVEIPEPSTLCLGLSALPLILLRRSRRARKPDGL
jgi:hypothetical protein